MTLLEKQQFFAILFAELIIEAYRMGYKVTYGELERPQITANAYAALGKGISDSNHLRRLAGDINLFFRGAFLTKSEDYLPLGKWWEARHPLCRWGGRFKRADGTPKPDGNHFSLEHNGVR